MAAEQKGPREVFPVQMDTGTKRKSPEIPPDPDEAADLRAPYYEIKPGEDTLDKDDNLLFSDFRPRIVDADKEEAEAEDAAPKASDVQESANSSPSTSTAIPSPPEATPVPGSAVKESGLLPPSPSEPSSPPSSSKKKAGKTKGTAESTG